MPTYRKIFVLENARWTTIRDNAGNEVNFDSIEDLNRCSGMDFTGKFYIGYEPDITFFQDSEDPLITAEDIPNTDYDWLINNISLLTERRDNPLYGLTGEALWEADKAVRTEAIYTTFNTDSEAPVTVTIPEGTFTFNGGQDSAGYIQGAVQLAQNLGETSVTITDVNNVSVPMAFTSGMAVATAVGVAFRTAFFVKQNALVAINNEVYPG